MSRRGPSLGRELDELERTDPTVAAARANYDRTVQRILAKTDLLAKAIRYLNQYHGEGVALPWHEHDAEVQALVDLLRQASAPEAKTPSGLSHVELIVACKNIGVDLECGACASVFYTGTGGYLHTCSLKNEPPLTIEVGPVPDQGGEPR